MFVRPTDDPLLSDDNNMESSQNKDQETISINLEKELNQGFSNEHNDDDIQQDSSMHSQSEETTATRTGRKIYKLFKCANYSMLLLGLITSQFASVQDNTFK